MIDYFALTFAPDPAALRRLGAFWYVARRTIGVFLLGLALSSVRFLLHGFATRNILGYLAIDLTVTMFVLVGSVVAVRRYQATAKLN